MKRRQFVQTLATTSALGSLGLMTGCASVAHGATPHVVVVGGGFGGATAAKYTRLFSEGKVRVTLIEPNAQFTSCPMSNLVIGGIKDMGFITHSYESLQRRHGVRLIADRVSVIDPDKRLVRLAGGGEVAYDRLIVSPGVDFIWQNLPGMASAEARGRIFHAWKAGDQTIGLRRQLEAMPDGGVFAITIPRAPYRCPPGPYERASVVAHYFKQHKPRSKVIIFDANDEIISKRALFTQAWASHYKDIIEYRPQHKLIDVDAATQTLKFDFNDDFRPAVANVIPDMRAGDIAVQTGMATANGRWCEVDFLTFESKAHRNVHVLGDAVQAAPLMPKSGHMANQHGKTCAAAVVNLLNGHEPSANPLYANTCYSFINHEKSIHVASVHRFDAAQRTMVTVPGSGGVSSEPNTIEGAYALGWAKNIWADMLA